MGGRKRHYSRKPPVFIDSPNSIKVNAGGIENLAAASQQEKRMSCSPNRGPVFQGGATGEPGGDGTFSQNQTGLANTQQAVRADSKAGLVGGTLAGNRKIFHHGKKSMKQAQGTTRAEITLSTFYFIF